MKKVLNFIFNINTGLISLLIITIILLYAADGKLIKYIQVGQEIVSAAVYDSKSADTEKQKPFEFKNVSARYSNSVEMSMDFSAYSFSNFQTLFDMGSKEGIIIDINAEGEIALDYKADENGKYLVNFLNKKMPFEKEKLNHLEIRISKDGEAVSILNGNEIVHKKLDRKIKFSSIKAGANTKNERVFDGKIENFNLKYISYEKSYFWQNISTFLLCIMFIFSIGALYKINHKSINREVIYGIEVLDKNEVYLEKIKAYLSQNLFSIGFAVCCIMVFFYILPIVLANVPFFDDYVRTLEQYYWDQDSRFLSSFLYKLFSLKTKLADFAPWGLITGSFILCLSAYLFSQKYNSQNTFTSVIAVIYLFSSPFLLQPLSYQLDVLPMLFSVIFCFWVFFVPNKNILAVVISTFIFTFCCLLTYQASVVIIPILALVEMIMLVKNNDNPKMALKLLFTRFCSFSSSMAVWYFTIYKNSRYLKYDVLRSSDIFIFERAKEIIDTISGWHVYNNFSWIILGILFIALCIITTIFCRKYIYGKDKFYRICGIIIVLSPFIILFIGVLGINIIQDHSINPRLFFSFSVFLFSLIFLLLNFYNKILRFILILLSSIPLVYSFGLSYTYGNALHYNYEINTLIASSLMDIITDDNIGILTIKGNIDEPKKLKNVFKTYPYIEVLLISERFKEKRGSSTTKLQYYGLKIKRSNVLNEQEKLKENEALEHINEAELVSKHYYYNLLLYKDAYILDFDKTDLSKNQKINTLAQPSPA
ncbi:MAG: glucosyltransferase domain-containing protein, partial [Endomicrobium sp.]|nr:glucosyltransferase domain-containing protein [Endomicrobium sp.]